MPRLSSAQAEARGAARLAVRRALAAALLASGAMSSTAPSAAAGAEIAAGGDVVTATLSNLKTRSLWAYPQEAALARQRPDARSRVVAQLRFLTQDGQAEVYMALRSRTVEGVTWILVSLPGRPNGTTGWVEASALGEMHISREYLRVNRETFRATLYRDGRRIWTAPVGVGRASLPTPAGHFYVTEKLTAVGGPFYGPYALGTSAYAPTLSDWPGGGIVGIHGTDEPQLIPGRPSHGCIRLRNSDITRLWRLIGVGTPIEIV
jgi:L,D-transpeptidase catalytic domain